MKKTWNKFSRELWIILLVLLIAGCQAEVPASTGTPEPLFIPPSSGPASEQNQVALPPAPPTQQGNCENQLRYLEDLTIPDGTEVLPEEKITKRWLIINEGSCNWDQSYSLQLISGLALGAKKYQDLYPVRQGSRAVLEITFNAPENPGRYNTWWQAFDASGKRFGDPIYMDINVLSD
ncbi:MAG: NBR1-Ig-like domain-containing protein [Anaerolineales bacterium]|nr:NBR1-Ig-like domain-containing protein [Anaerolineales bacterium]